MPQYVFKSKPFEHQESVFETSAEREYYAFLMEQGTGKTKPTIDTGAYLYESGKIDGMIVAAPNGVHRKWLIEDIPLSLPDRIPFRAVVWKAQSAPIKRAFDNLLLAENCFRIFLINTEALSHKSGADLVKAFLKKYRTYFAIDESGRIKNPGSQRTDEIVNLGGLAKYRRILNGLPVSKSPFDLYAQFQFLDPAILGTSFVAFKSRYGEFHQINKGPDGKYVDGLIQSIMSKNPRIRRAPMIEQTDAHGNKKYKNLEKLKLIIAPHSFRITKEECFDLPPKIYESRYFKMTADQRRIYDSIDQDLRAEINGEMHIIDHALTKQLRLQQITSGFMGTGESEPVAVCIDDTENPRLQLLKDTLQDIDGSVNIWCRFKEEVRKIKAMLGDKAVTYYGETTDPDANLRLFKSGQVPYMVGTASKGGIGHNFTVAATAIYYSNTFDYEHRAQSEDRNHRYGIDTSKVQRVLYIDLQAEESVDQDIVASMKMKKDLGDYMMGKRTTLVAAWSDELFGGGT